MKTNSNTNNTTKLTVSSSDWDEAVLNESRNSPLSDPRKRYDEKKKYPRGLEVEEEEEEEVILEEIDSNRFKLTVPRNVSPGDEIEVNDGKGKSKIVKIKAGIKPGDVFVIDFNDRETRQHRFQPSQDEENGGSSSPGIHNKNMNTSTDLVMSKPSITTSVGIVVKKMVNCGCLHDSE